MKYCTDCTRCQKDRIEWFCDKEYPSLLHGAQTCGLSCYDARHASYACGIDAQHFQAVEPPLEIGQKITIPGYGECVLILIESQDARTLMNPNTTLTFRKLE